MDCAELDRCDARRSLALKVVGEGLRKCLHSEAPMSLTMASRQLCIPSSSLESLVYQEFIFISRYLAIATTSSLFYGGPV